MNRSNSFLQELSERILIADGAMGTFMQDSGLPIGSISDEWSITKPDIILKAHKSYFEAGADIIVTNTFNAIQPKLEEYGLGDKVEEINYKSVKLARQVVENRGYVAASIPPLGQYIKPLGTHTLNEAVDVYTKQVEALEQADPDLFFLETMSDIREIKAAVIAIKSLSNKPIVAMMTFQSDGRTYSGTTPLVAAATLSALGVNVIGANCSLGSFGIHQSIVAMNEATSLPKIARPNAGIPIIKNGKTFFPSSPEKMAEFVESFIDSGIRIVGGCCGTTPKHIKAISEAVKKVSLNRTLSVAGIKDDKYKTVWLASRTKALPVGGNHKPILIGERINPTGRKKLLQQLLENKSSYIINEALKQVKKGAHLLDVNVGHPKLNEISAMTYVTDTIQDSIDVPLVLDSPKFDVIEAGLLNTAGRPLINSVNAEQDKMGKLFKLAKKYGAAVIALPIDEKGIPETAEQRLVLINKIIDEAKKYGLTENDIIIDCLTLTVSSNATYPIETLKTVKMVKEELGLPTLLGVSNVSYGLPERELLNSSFLSMAIENGLDAAIVNPKQTRMIEACKAASVLTGRDLNASDYIKTYVKSDSSNKQKNEDIKKLTGIELTYKKITNRIIEGDKEGIDTMIDNALNEEIPHLDIINNGMMPGMNEVGRRFKSGEYFLPQVMLSAETMKIGFTKIKKSMPSLNQSSKKIVMASVEGDVHDIGKNIVITLLENNGYDVIDLGKSIKNEQILEQSIKHNVDLIGLSALMTTTINQMEDFMTLAKERKVDIPVIIGGAVVTQEFAEQIGAFYSQDAMEAIDKIDKILKQ